MSEPEGDEGGNDRQKEVAEGFFGAAEGTHFAHSALELGAGAGWGDMGEMMHEGLGLSKGAASAAEGVSSGLGAGLGAINFGKGVGELINAKGNLGSSEGSQGGLDVLSGGLGMATLACPALAPAAAIAGIGAFGNEAAEKNGWYNMGQDMKGGENQTFFGGIGHGASEGWEAGHALAGDGLAGDALGAVAGGLDATGHAVWNSGAAIAGAGYRAAEGIGSAANWVGGKASDAAGWAGDKVSGAWDTVTDW